jgi:hypothetical protein
MTSKKIINFFSLINSKLNKNRIVQRPVEIGLGGNRRLGQKSQFQHGGKRFGQKSKLQQSGKECGQKVYFSMAGLKIRNKKKSKKLSNSCQKVVKKLSKSK